MKYSFLAVFLIGIFAYVSLTNPKEEEPYIPGSYKALDLWNFQRAYPEDNIPDGYYYQGFLDHKRDYVQRARSPRSEEWKGMGPLNTAGRTLTLAVNPLADSTIYMGTASGGLWMSRRLGLGRSWERVETGFPVLGVSTIEFAPADSMVMYIGTGEVYNIESTGTDGADRGTRGSYGIGILKSVDGGQTWRKSLDWTYQESRGVWMIKVAPTDPSIVYAGTTAGVFKSTDAGDTWELVNTTVMATDVEIHPSDENDVVAAFGNFSTPGNGIYRTRDGGVTWRQIEIDNLSELSFNGKILLARSKSNPEKLYASVGNGFSFSDGATTFLSTEDGGDNWTAVNDHDYSRWQGWFSHDVAIDPIDENYVVAVGIEVEVSLDGGAAFVNPNRGNVTLGLPPIEGPDGPPDYVHSDIHYVGFHPNIRGLVLIGTDGGLFLSEDAGLTYRSANGGLQTTQFYNGFSVSHQDSVLAMGGLQDNSTSINRGDGLWQRAVGGDGSWTAISSDDDDIVYGSSQNLRIQKSFNRGNNFTSGVTPGFAFDEQPIFIAPYLSTVDSPDVLYAGGRYIYKSENGGDDWEIMNRGSQIQSGNPIFAMDDYDLDSDIVYIATAPETQRSSIFTTQDGGDTWTESVSGLPDRVPNDVIIFNENPAFALACYSGFGTDHLFLSLDFGTSWVAMDNGLPDVPGNAIAIDANNQIIYYGTDLSVYSAPYELDGTGVSIGDWVFFGEGLPSAVIAMDLEISPSDQALWVATHGNGTYKRNLIDATMTSTEELSGLAVSVYPNPTSDRVRLEYQASSDYAWSLYSVSGIHIQSGQIDEVELSDLPAGPYILQVRDENQGALSVIRIVKE